MLGLGLGIDVGTLGVSDMDFKVTNGDGQVLGIRDASRIRARLRRGLHNELNPNLTLIGEAFMSGSFANAKEGRNPATIYEQRT